MMSEERKELSDYIKSVHLSLRCKSRQIGAETAWKQHLDNEEVLRNYSVCMKKLAQNYWPDNNKKDKSLCRIRWMLHVIKDYFRMGGLEKEITKENKKLRSFTSKNLTREVEIKQYPLQAEFSEPYKLLDVGSCYNPFGAYELFETFPIDLYPATAEVKKCDFTQLLIGDFGTEDRGNWFHYNLEILPRNFFDIVVFSLFVEYLPSPKQRYVSCQKAYEVLKVNGLLLIATPDSKHESANARIMKIWKLALAQIGFVRVKLEKLKYIYCMAYRKSGYREYPLILYNITNSNEEASIPIPQDFVDYKTDEISPQMSDISEEDLKETFAELPFS